MNKIVIGAVVAILIVGGGSFYAGMSYASGQTPAQGQFASATTSGQFAGRAGAARGASGGLVTGEIVAASNGSITIQPAMSSSTQIVLVGSSTQILKSAQGSLSDLTQGTSVTITGTTNSDGSLSAQSIQVRPAGMPGMSGRAAATGTQGQSQ